jgi:hypothetical protein
VETVIGLYGGARNVSDLVERIHYVEIGDEVDRYDREEGGRGGEYEAEKRSGEGEGGVRYVFKKKFNWSGRDTKVVETGEGDSESTGRWRKVERRDEGGVMAV